MMTHDPKSYLEVVEDEAVYSEQVREQHQAPVEERTCGFSSVKNPYSRRLARYTLPPTCHLPTGLAEHVSRSRNQPPLLRGARPTSATTP